MKPSGLFGVVIRTVGFLVILYSLYDIWGGFDSFFENLLSGGQEGNSSSASTLTYFVFGVPGLALGAVFFFLADWIVKLAYRNAS